MTVREIVDKSALEDSLGASPEASLTPEPAGSLSDVPSGTGPSRDGRWFAASFAKARDWYERLPTGVDFAIVNGGSAVAAAATFYVVGHHVDHSLAASSAGAVLLMNVPLNMFVSYLEPRWMARVARYSSPAASYVAGPVAYTLFWHGVRLGFITLGLDESVLSTAAGLAPSVPIALVSSTAIWSVARQGKKIDVAHALVNAFTVVKETFQDHFRPVYDLGRIGFQLGCESLQERYAARKPAYVLETEKSD